MLEQAILIFKMDLFLNLVTILLRPCNSEQVVITRNFVSFVSTVYQSLNKVAIFPKIKVTLDLAEEALKVLVYYRKTSFAQTFLVKIAGVEYIAAIVLKQSNTIRMREEWE